MLPPFMLCPIAGVALATAARPAAVWIRWRREISVMSCLPSVGYETIPVLIKSCLPFTRQQGAVDGQPPERHAGRGIDGVADGGGRGGHPGLADAAGRLAAGDQMHVDFRRLVDPEHAIVMEIGLAHPSLGQRDLAEQG